MNKSKFLIKYNLMIKLLNNDNNIWIKGNEGNNKVKLLQNYLINLGFNKLKKKKDIIRSLYKIEYAMVKKMNNLGNVKKNKIIVQKTESISNNIIENYDNIYEKQEIKVGKKIVKYHKPITFTKKTEKQKNQILTNKNTLKKLDTKVLTNKKYLTNKNTLNTGQINNLFEYIITNHKDLFNKKSDYL